MNTDTGVIKTEAEMAELSPLSRRKFVPIRRDLTKQEMLKRQIDLYTPCGCGSGRKFKFCCKTNG